MVARRAPHLSRAYPAPPYVCSGWGAAQVFHCHRPRAASLRHPQCASWSSPWWRLRTWPGAQTSESGDRLPSFALCSGCSLPPSAPSPSAFLPNTQSFIPQTTYKPPICLDHTAPLPSSAPGDNGCSPTSILPGPTPKPNYHLGTSGRGGGEH